MFYLTCWHLWSPSRMGAYNPVEKMHVNTQNKKRHIYGPICQWKLIDTETLLAWKRDDGTKYFIFGLFSTWVCSGQSWRVWMVVKSMIWNFRISQLISLLLRFLLPLPYRLDKLYICRVIYSLAYIFSYLQQEITCTLFYKIKRRIHS